MRNVGHTNLVENQMKVNSHHPVLSSTEFQSFDVDSVRLAHSTTQLMKLPHLSKNFRSSCLRFDFLLSMVVEVVEKFLIALVEVH